MKFEFLAGNLALDLTNTVHKHGSDDPEDDLTTPAHFVEWSLQSGVLSREEKRLDRKRCSASQFRNALELRELVYAIFKKVAHGKRPDPMLIKRLQDLYRDAVRHLEFQCAGSHYHLGWAASTGPIDRVLFEVVQSAADLLSSRDLAEVRQCSGETCTWLFVDRSRNGLRRWCDMKMCGNRAKVRRFRRRTAPIEYLE